MSISPKKYIDDKLDFVSDPKIRKEVDTTDGSVIYQGYAQLESTTSQAVWRIKRTTISGSIISIEWADSNTKFDNIWTNRGSLNYG